MRFAREGGIPAQGRGSAANSIVAYVLGITRVDPIRHNLLFERFINEGRTSYPDIDIDFSSERREEVIQYVYRRYGPEHTGMVCNLVTYRARSAVREVGYALGFPRPLVDRVAKALETYDSVMVRRDLEADGGFGQFFAETVEREVEAVDAAETTTEHGLTDRMGQLNHPRGSRIGGGSATEHERRLARKPPAASDDEGGPETPGEHRLVGRGGRLVRHPGALRIVRPEPHSSVARVQPQPPMPPELRRGSTAGFLTGSAGWRSVPASTASRATSASTPAACS